MFFAKHKKESVVLMTALLIIAYIGRFTNLIWLFDVSMIAIAIIGGLPLVFRAVGALKFKIISIELLVSIAVISALAIGEYSEAGIVVWLFSVGDLLEEITLKKTRRSIQDLVDMAPKTALKIESPSDRSFEEVDIDEIEKGDYLLVKTGSQIPVDGQVVAGNGHVDQASITGESKPSHKEIGSSVFAGTILSSGTLVVQAEKVGEDTTFGRLIELVEEAQDSQTKTQRFIDRFSQYYTPLVLLLSIIVGLITKDLRLAITILVLGCPGALVIGVPISTVAGIGSAAKRGMIAKGSAALDELTKIDTFVFDKTGTLTTGQPSVGKVVNVNGDQNENLKILASIEHESNHPLAKAILDYWQKDDVYPVSDSQIIDGRGIQAVVNQHSVLVGNERLLNEAGIETTTDQLSKTSSHVLLAVDHELRLVLEVSDQLRPGAKAALDNLRKIKDYRLILLSGDNQAAAENMVADLNFNEVRGDLLPVDKAAVIKQLQSDGHQVAFVGDGINDSPALSVADLGIAMGSGTEAAIDVADIILVNSSPAQLPIAVRHAQKTMHNMYENIAIALLTVLLLFIGLFTGYIYMASGMLVHELSILIVILNGMRLIRRN